MNCESVKDNISLFLYGELTFEDEQGFEDHVAACVSCSAVFEKEKKLHRLLGKYERMPSPELLANCRRDLSAQLRAVAPPKSLGDRLKGFVNSFRLTPALARPIGAVCLVALGFFAARLTVPSPAGTPARLVPVSGITAAEPVISRVRTVQPDASGRVQIVVDETRQRIITGSLDDENINRLLLASLKEAADPGLRGESMDILKARTGSSSEVREALLQAVEHDPNPGVRLKAMEALNAFGADTAVRAALARVLLNDENPGVRTQAVDLLVQHKEDALVGVLQASVQRDDNSYVRQRCQKALEEMKASVGTF